MASSSNRTTCVVCNKEKLTYPCQGCSTRFCFDHLAQHRTNLSQQLEHIQDDHNEIRQTINDQKLNSTEHSIMKQIDQWEKESIDKIQQTAERCRQKWIHYSNEYLLHIEKNLNTLAEKIREMRQEKEFNEIDLNNLKQKCEELQKELRQPPNIFIQEQSTKFLTKIALITPSKKDACWKQSGTTIVGGNGRGHQLDQLNCPWSICVDNDDQTIYVADCLNHRIVEWKLMNATIGRIVAGGNGEGNRLDQLDSPRDVIIDQEKNFLIIADRGNNRVMRWSRTMSEYGQIIIENIDCTGLAMHQDGTLYVSDYKKNEVKRWKKGETQGKVVAGGNGRGNRLDQLSLPTYLFVDDNHTLYVTDEDNHRVMKWRKGAKEGIVVAGGNGKGDWTTQLSDPEGVVLDRFGQIYVSDSNNHRVMRWCEGAKEGTIVVGGNDKGQEANQLSYPVGLSLDDEGNFYVVENGNDRIQKFMIE